MSRELDHYYIFTAVDFDSMLYSRHVHKLVVLLCVKNNILMDISGTKENGKFPSGENLDIDVRMFLTKYGCSKRWFT